MSQEAIALAALGNEKAPDIIRAGDIYVIETGRHRYTMLVLGHKKNGRRSSDGHSFVWLYHMDEPCLRTKPADLRDFDCNANQAEAWIHNSRARGERVYYAGTIFDFAPLAALTRSL